MGRRACTFRQGDVTRALKAVRAAGADVRRVEIGKDGKVVMVLANGNEPTAEQINEWDAVTQNGTD